MDSIKELPWSDPQDITKSIGGAFVPGPGVGIQFESGRLLISGYGKVAPTSRDTRSQVIYSDDHGKTWKAGAQVSGTSNESQAVELIDGTLMLSTRTNRKERCRYLALSRDGGESWFRDYDETSLVEASGRSRPIRERTYD